MELRRAIWPFFKSVIAASVVAGMIGGSLAAVLQPPDIGFSSALTGFAVVLVFTFIAVLAGAVFIGLPATLLLWRLNLENTMSYAFTGGGCGALLPVLLVPEPYLFEIYPLMGAVAGVVAGAVWWHTYRRHAAKDGK